MMRYGFFSSSSPVGAEVWKSEITFAAGMVTPPGQFRSVGPVGPQLVPVRQVPLQSTCPVGQAHLPPLQTWPPVQALPQVPQFAELVLVSVQVPLQSWSPPGQVQ